MNYRFNFGGPVVAQVLIKSHSRLDGKAGVTPAFLFLLHKNPATPLAFSRLVNRVSRYCRRFHWVWAGHGMAFRFSIGNSGSGVFGFRNGA